MTVMELPTHKYILMVFSVVTALAFKSEKNKNYNMLSVLG